MSFRSIDRRDRWHAPAPVAICWVQKRGRAAMDAARAAAWASIAVAAPPAPVPASATPQRGGRGGRGGQRRGGGGGGGRGGGSRGGSRRQHQPQQMQQQHPPHGQFGAGCQFQPQQMLPPQMQMQQMQPQQMQQMQPQQMAGTGLQHQMVKMQVSARTSCVPSATRRCSDARLCAEAAGSTTGRGWLRTKRQQVRGVTP